MNASMSIERVVVAISAIAILLSLVLAYFVSQYWLAFAAIVALNLSQSAFTGYCPVAYVLKKVGMTPATRSSNQVESRECCGNPRRAAALSAILRSSIQPRWFMHFNRRDRTQDSRQRHACYAVGSRTCESQALKVLILGGTGFIGPHFVDALTAGGHKITLFNRGKRDPEVKPGIEQLLGDRNGQIDTLKGRDWDVVIDNSGYTPSQVKATAELLKDHVREIHLHLQHRRVRRLRQGRRRRGLQARRAQGPTTEVVNGETYGGLKVLCEKVVETTYGKRATIIRPTYIAGPATTPIGLPTGRSAYPRAARCSRRVRPAIRFSTSTCATSRASSAPVSRRMWTASSTVRTAGRRHHGIAAR
jgi:hypothetical protein